MASQQVEIQFYERERQKPHSSAPINESFPEKDANGLARLESFNKNLFRPNTYLHKWWARRSGTTFRFILKHLVPDEELRDYYVAGGLEGITVLDPMMGGGTTLHEAIRLGANVIGYDLDPVPVLQVRASLLQVPVEEKEQVFQGFLGELEKKLRPYFQTQCVTCRRPADLQFVLYGVRKNCSCGEALVVDSLLLREDPNGYHKRIEEYYPSMQVKRGRHQWSIFEKGKTRCQVCGKSLGNTTELSFPERYVPLVTVGFCPSDGQFFKAVDKRDLDAIAKAKKTCTQARLPEKESLRILRGPKSSDLLSKKIENYLDLFTPRYRSFRYFEGV